MGFIAFILLTILKWCLLVKMYNFYLPVCVIYYIVKEIQSIATNGPITLISVLEKIKFFKVASLFVCLKNKQKKTCFYINECF